jgi:hypothetical protein
VQCWGDNSFGQLGDGTTTLSTTPVSVSGIGTATAITTGHGQTCALLADNTVQCWGNNTYGQLGNGTSAIATSPVSVTGVPGMVWSSSNTSVATIDANGVATALSPGNATITATATDGSVNGTTTLHINSYTVGGSVTGLTGTVVLQNNGTDDLSLAANGGFTFATALANGASYNVTVATQPVDQSCTVTSGSNTINGANITDVAVTCTTTTSPPPPTVSSSHTVGGTVSGLTGSVVLENNGADSLSVGADGNFTFATVLAGGAAYDISVATQPTGQTCTVANGTGMVGSTDVTDVAVTCSTDSVAPLSKPSGGGGGGTTSPCLLALLGVALTVRAARSGRRRMR